MVKTTITTDIKEIINVLRRGGVIIYPTETSYGIGCDATNEKAIKKIYEIKKRDKNKPFIVLVQNEKMADKYLKLNKISKTLIKMFSPGPLTLVCDSKILPNISGENSFRISSDKFVQRLLKSYKNPITSTSANISGNKALFKIDEVKKTFYGKVDIIVDGGDLKNKRLSTVFDTRSLKVLRKGVIQSKEIYDVISKNVVICGGCFNTTHKGHEYFLKNAKTKGDYLIVVV
ncbi:MAG: threonylcarbamoyl-AMP synthase [Candidatus Aenigmarchaeota archaeon]|nr:threonylcarbamoyl-AMP synthase [Candidatus Aenigmarchaeota archaeon]